MNWFLVFHPILTREYIINNYITYKDTRGALTCHRYSNFDPPDIVGQLSFEHFMEEMVGEVKNFV